MKKRVVTLFLLTALVVNCVFGLNIAKASSLNGIDKNEFVLDGDFSLEDGAKEVIVKRNTKIAIV